MVYIYTVISAVILLVINGFNSLFHSPNGWWLVPVLFVGFILGFVILQMSIFAGMILFTSLKKERKKSSSFFRFMVKISLPIIVSVARVEIRTEGAEKMPKDRPVMLVCNHQHDVDPAVIFSVFPDSKLSFIGKKEIYTTMPFVAKAMHRLDCLPIDRENDRAAALTIIKAIKYVKSARCSMAIFPEGYCSKNCELLPLRNGCFKIATKANVPIAVCVLNNTRQVPKNIFRRKTVVDFRLVDVIYPETFKDMNTAEIGEMVHKQMKTALAEIRK